MPATPPAPPPFTHPEPVRVAAAEDVRARIAAGSTQRDALAAVAEPLQVSRTTIQRWAGQLGIDIGPQEVAARQRNAVTQHLTMSMQRQRDLAQRLLRVIDVQVLALERQARRGSNRIDSVLLGRTVGDLSALQRLDERLMLQVGRARGAETDQAADLAERAASVVDEYASEWERDRALFRPAAGGAEG